MSYALSFRSFLSSILLLLLISAPGFAGDDKEKDPDAIGDRNVSGKVNFYSIEKEIALGNNWLSRLSGLRK
ncbi:MAG TPA: hypothetical protein VHZ55_00540 [Bryobacteraceae bacterium]|jgi:hypothetical protein|nr:hypothetical protein [Bryobacteraceae bacterium]